MRAQGTIRSAGDLRRRKAGGELLVARATPPLHLPRITLMRGSRSDPVYSVFDSSLSNAPAAAKRPGWSRTQLAFQGRDGKLSSRRGDKGRKLDSGRRALPSLLRLTWISMARFFLRCYLPVSGDVSSKPGSRAVMNRRRWQVNVDLELSDNANEGRSWMWSGQIWTSLWGQTPTVPSRISEH